MSDDFKMSDLLRDPVVRSEDAILAGILRRALAENRDSLRAAENELRLYAVLPVSDTEAAAIRRVLEDP